VDASRKLAILRTALEQLHTRITRDLSLGVNGASAPSDASATARRIEALLRFTNETYRTALDQAGQ